MPDEDYERDTARVRDNQAASAHQRQRTSIPRGTKRLRWPSVSPGGSFQDWAMPCKKCGAGRSACFLTIGALVFLAVGMRGNVFSSEGSDAFGMLGYAADLGTGSFYLAARALETDGSDTAHAEGDDGTRFLAAAGVLNLLAALHAYEAARGRKA